MVNMTTNNKASSYVVMTIIITVRQSAKENHFHMNHSRERRNFFFFVADGELICCESQQRAKRAIGIFFLLYINLISVKKAGDPRNGEPGLAEAVCFGIDGIVEGRAEIRFFKAGVMEKDLQQITLLK